MPDDSGTVDLDDATARQARRRRARCRGPSEPVDTTCRSFWIWASPIFMIEPLPNCFSICASAAASALFFWSSIDRIEGHVVISGVSPGGLAAGKAGVTATGSWHRTIVRCKPREQPKTSKADRAGPRPPRERSSNPCRAVATLASRTAWRSPEKRWATACTAPPRMLQASQTRPTGLSGSSSAWSGDARDGDREVRATACERACGHLANGGLAHRSELRERLLAHAEELHLRLVRIGDEAAVEPVGAPGNVGDRAGDEAPGAGFGGRHAPPARPKRAAQFRREIAPRRHYSRAPGGPR